jgi:hypothetical protein
MSIVAPDTDEVVAAITGAACLPGNDVTATLRDLTMDAHDPPYVLLEFNPWQRTVRAESETPHAWADGAWSGHEWLEAVTVPLNVLVKTADAARGTDAWWALQRALSAAFAPSHVDIPLSWTQGASSYLLYGRPRLVEPLAETVFRGWGLCRAAFRALDPHIYSGGNEHSVTLGLPQFTGGLTIPLTVPFSITGSVTVGQATLTNAGTTATGLLLRIDGPVQEPSVSLLPSGGSTQTLRYLDDLAAGEYLEIDTRARTAYTNGGVSRRGRVVGDWFLLEPGSSEIAFNAAAYNASALLTVTWRDAFYG